MLVRIAPVDRGHADVSCDLGSWERKEAVKWESRAVGIVKWTNLCDGSLEERGDGLETHGFLFKVKIWGRCYFRSVVFCQNCLLNIQVFCYMQGIRMFSTRDRLFKVTLYLKF